MQDIGWDYSLAPHKDSVVEIGSRHGRLEVTGDPEPTEPGKKHKMVPVRCSCGNELKVALWSLRSGNTKSCGCYKAANGRRRMSH